MKLVILNEVIAALSDLPLRLSGKISGALGSLEVGKTKDLLIKPIKGKIMELSVGQYRIIFCNMDAMIYVILLFKKQSRKTPLRIIRRAERICVAVANVINNKKIKL